MNKTFEEWKKENTDHCNREEINWKCIGDWMYPTKDNTIYREIVDHICKERKQQSPDSLREFKFDRCIGCGEKVPDGIKMIALLEKL